jgi:hypothetical protein
MGRSRNAGLVEEWCVANAAGTTALEFAKDCGISASTVRHWRSLPAGQARILQHREVLTAATLKAMPERSALQAAAPADPPTVVLVQPA